MTDYHKLLGVEKNASKEEIKKAYEMQVDKMKKEVVNEKRLNQFLKIFDEAYEALISLEENQSVKENLTVAINPKEIQKEKSIVMKRKLIKVGVILEVKQRVLEGKVII